MQRNDQQKKIITSLKPASASAAASSPSQPEYDILLKMRLVGDSGVGKSCLLLRYCDGTYSDSYISTIGLDFKIKNVSMMGKNIKIQVWDTAGQERFRNVKSTYDSGHHAVVAVFDLTDMVSFRNLDRHLDGFMDESKDKETPIIIVGTKTDSTGKRVVSDDDVNQYINNTSRYKGNIVSCIYTSAKTDDCVDIAFETAAQSCLERYAPSLFASAPASTSTSAAAPQKSAGVGGWLMSFFKSAPSSASSSKAASEQSTLNHKK